VVDRNGQRKRRVLVAESTRSGLRVDLRWVGASHEKIRAREAHHELRHGVVQVERYGSNELGCGCSQHSCDPCLQSQRLPCDPIYSSVVVPIVVPIVVEPIVIEHRLVVTNFEPGLAVSALFLDTTQVDIAGKGMPAFELRKQKDLLNMVRLTIASFALFLLPTCLCESSAKADTVGDCIAIEFSADGFQECETMHRTTDQAIEQGWVVRRFDTKRDPHVALRWQIQSVPTTILVRNGREMDRILGPVDYRELSRRMTTASSVDSMKDRTRNEPFVRSQSPTNNLTTINLASNALVSNAGRGGSNTNFESTNRALGDERTYPATNPRTASVSPGSPRDSTVRIRIEEAQQDSVGTGTVIDMVNGEALVLTCGHLFRDNQGQAKITIETFIKGQTQAYPATLVDFQAKDMDIGLVAFRPASPVPVARLIPRSRKLEEGQSVTSWGCNRGADPTRMDSRITKLNRYLGAPNVETDGLPVEGRSGGGLFDDRGELIGVCYAADPSLKEGLYSAADVVYIQLEKLGLQRLFNERQESSGVVTAVATEPVSPPLNRAMNIEASNPPGSPVEMTVLLRDRNGKQERFDIVQPSEQLLQAMRQSARR
jgi:hypothetical protein